MPLQSPNRADSGPFSKDNKGFTLQMGPDKEVFLCLSRGYGRFPGRRHIYILLCMFNGFAFARPFCRAIKVGLTGVEF